MPSESTVGEAVYRMNKGGIQGLQDLGLVEKMPKGRKGDRSQTVSAFSQLYSFMDEKLTTEDKEVTKFSGLVLENALCKYRHCAA
jgi:hypothetical protein